MAKGKLLTPEGAVLKAIKDWLVVAHLGKVKRVNVGQLRVGDAPKHPWAKDTRRTVRFGEVGAADLCVELDVNDRRIPAVFRGRDLHIEVKEPDWTPPAVPKFGAAPSTLAKYRHHVDQVTFLTRQNERGNLGFFARSPRAVYERLVRAGFLGLPEPQEPRKVVARPTAAPGGMTKASGGQK